LCGYGALEGGALGDEVHAAELADFGHGAAAPDAALAAGGVAPFLDRRQ
jgi:hypothetical protein